MGMSNHVVDGAIKATQQKVGEQFRIASMATATAKKIELEADTSRYSFDVLCNVAKLYNSSCDSIDTAEIEAEIEAEIHNSSCDSIDTWFMAAGPDTEFN